MTEPLPIDPGLVASLKEAKEKEKIAKQQVLDAQSAIYMAVASQLPEKGTTKFQGIKITTGLYEKWDQDQLNLIFHNWKHNITFPFKLEYKADGRALSALKKIASFAYADLVPALTTTPKKPTFKLEGEKDESDDD